MKVPYFVPWLNQQDKKMVQQAMEQRWLTNGPILKRFERKICSFINSKYAIGVSNATSALHLAVKSLDIGPGDEVIVPNFTFAATVNSVIYCGAKPVLVDVDLKTFNILPNEIEKKISKKTKAIIPVHYGGQACDMKEILSIARKNNLKVIEDCAHALGSEYNKTKCGNLGTVGCFSFYPTKIITTGEGGMVTTNDNVIQKKINLLKFQGMDILPELRETEAKWRYDILDLGYNYRLDEIRSALGFSQMKRIKQINSFRIKIAKKYLQMLRKIPGLSVPIIKENRNHIFHLYTIKIEKNYHLTRDELIKKLYKHGIGTSVQYYPIHLMTFYKKHLKHKSTDFPNSNILKDQVLSLPIYPKMNQKQIEYVISHLT